MGTTLVMEKEKREMSLNNFEIKWGRQADLTLSNQPFSKPRDVSASGRAFGDAMASTPISPWEKRLAISTLH